MIIVGKGTPQTLVLNVEDEDVPANNPVTGQTVTVAIRRSSDDKWYDFVAVIWDTFASYTAIGASNKQALTDKGDGTYAYQWDQTAADAGVVRDYEMVYEIPSGTYKGMDCEHWSFIEGVGLTTTERAAIANAVLDEEVNSATATDNSLRAAAKAAWAQGFGKWALVGNILTLYGTDGTAVVRTFTIDNLVNPTSRIPV